MTDLFDECPEAVSYCQSVLANLPAHTLFDGETFAATTAGVLASDSVDSQNERFPPGALQALVTKIETEGLWSLVDHDPTIHPIGRAIAAKLFFAAPSRTWFVAGVMGAYDSSSFPSLADVGINPYEDAAEFDWPNEPSLDALDVTVGASPHEVDLDDLKAAVATFPRARLERTFRKAFDPLTVVTVSVSLFMLAQVPFLKKYQERMGEKAADATLSLLEWLKTAVALPLFRRAKRRTLLEIAAESGGCRIQFLIDSTTCTDVAAAVDAVQQAAINAATMVKHIAPLGPQKLVYLYDSAAGRWFPLHAATRARGVLSDRPMLIALEKYGSFSLGGANQDGDNAV